MKVYDLMSKLADISPNAEIVLIDRNGTWNDIMFLNFHKSLYTSLGEEKVMRRYPDYEERLDITLRQR